MPKYRDVLIRATAGSRTLDLPAAFAAFRLREEEPAAALEGRLRHALAYASVFGKEIDVQGHRAHWDADEWETLCTVRDDADVPASLTAVAAWLQAGWK